jgi:hypothetical protein
MHREARRKRAPQGTAKQFALGAKLTVDEIDDYIGCVRLAWVRVYCKEQKKIYTISDTSYWIHAAHEYAARE